MTRDDKKAIVKDARATAKDKPTPERHIGVWVDGTPSKRWTLRRRPPQPPPYPGAPIQRITLAALRAQLRRMHEGDEHELTSEEYWQTTATDEAAE